MLVKLVEEYGGSGQAILQRCHFSHFGDLAVVEFEPFAIGVNIAPVVAAGHTLTKLVVNDDGL